MTDETVVWHLEVAIYSFSGCKIAGLDVICAD